MLSLRTKIANSLIPYQIVFAAATIYLFFLISSVQPDIYYQGDGGVKSIVIQQIKAGEGFKYLRLPQADWVHQIWNAGFFPMKEPFVYKSERGLLISFPPAFQMANAYLFKWFGYYGLYLIPILSTLLLWLGFIWTLRKLQVHNSVISLGFFVMVFCSPLTIYGATYWEHMPAVSLVFLGTAFLASGSPSVIFAAAAGLCAGAAVWLRPEALLIDVFYILIAILNFRSDRQKSNLVFVLCVTVPVAGFFLFNQLIFGSVLGVHGYQVVSEHSKILRGIKNLLVINWLLLRFFPFVLIFILFISLHVVRRWPMSKTIYFLGMSTLGFCCFAPFMLPNRGGGQWGPRYFLPIIPIMSVVLWDSWARWRPMLKNQLLLNLLMIALIAFSFYLNVYEGGLKALRGGYASRVKPALEYIRQSNDSAIITNSDHIPMEMGALFRKRNFFLTSQEANFDSLAKLLRKAGVQHTILISENDLSAMVSNADSIQLRQFKKGSYFISHYSITP